MTSYNGWTNYETWNANLWLGEDSSKYWENLAQEIYDKFSGTDREAAATYELSKTMAADFEENRPDLPHGPYLDMLLAAMSEINWLEIAEHFIESVSR